MGLSEDVNEHLLIHVDPVGWWEATGSAPPILCLDDKQEAGHEALEEMQHVAHRLYAMPKRGPHGAVKDHLPLNTTLGRKEGGGVYGELQLHGRAAWNTTRRTMGWLALDCEQDTVVGGCEFAEAMLTDESLLHGLKMTVGTSIRGAEAFDT